MNFDGRHLGWRARLRWACTNEGGYWGAAVAAVGVGAQLYGMSSSPSGKVPTSVRAEMAEQKARQDEAFRMQQLMQPFLLDQMGLEAVMGPGGQITGLRKRALTKSEQQDADIKDLANQKVLKGLRGELDIDPGATRSLNEQDAQQKEFLARTLGPDYKLSTAGGTALSRESESRNVTEASIRTGETTSAEAIAQGRISNEMANQKMQIGLAGGIPNADFNMATGMAFPDTNLASLQYGMQSGRGTGWAQFGSGLMGGASGILGAYLANQRRNPVYSPGGRGYSAPPPSGYDPAAQSVQEF